MKIVLKDHPCYVNVLGRTMAEEHGKTISLPRPKLFVIEGAIAASNNPHKRVEVSALLDVGNDITIVRPKLVREMEKLLGYDLPLKRGRRILYQGDAGARLEPVLDLIFTFPGDHSYSSKYGFIVPSTKIFDVADVWIGQDIFSQLVTTFDGVKGTVTIIDPKAPSMGLKEQIQSLLYKLLSLI